MRTINITIPTSIAEIKTWWKQRTSKRYAHNCDVLFELTKEIWLKVDSGYWSKDISDEMKNRVFNIGNPNSTLREVYRNAITKMK